jgi:hypothetical protein
VTFSPEIKMHRIEQPIWELRRKALKAVGRYCADNSVECVERSEYFTMLYRIRRYKADVSVIDKLIKEYYEKIDNFKVG